MTWRWMPVCTDDGDDDDGCGGVVGGDDEDNIEGWMRSGGGVAFRMGEERRCGFLHG